MVNSPQHKVKPDVFGFRVNHLNILLLMDDLHSVTYLPKLAVMPGTRQWFLGCAKYGHQITPFINFAQYLGLTPTPNEITTHVVMIKAEGTPIGLLVDEIRESHVSVDACKIKTEQAPVSDLLKDYIISACTIKEETYYLVDIARLVKCERFLNVSL
ncbi:MAG: chemotaxis protein CheW [Pseudomonadales bacterium]